MVHILRHVIITFMGAQDSIRIRTRNDIRIGGIWSDVDSDLRDKVHVRTRESVQVGTRKDIQIETRNGAKTGTRDDVHIGTHNDE